MGLTIQQKKLIKDYCITLNINLDLMDRNAFYDDYQVTYGNTLTDEIIQELIYLLSFYPDSFYHTAGYDFTHRIGDL